jgi:hypothetical protein
MRSSPRCGSRIQPSTRRRQSRPTRHTQRRRSLPRTSSRAVAARIPSCHAEGGGMVTVAPGARAATWAMLRSTKSAPPPSMPAPRSSNGHGVRHAETRQSGSAMISPTGTATRLASTDATGTAPDIRAMSGAHPAEAASDALMPRARSCRRFPIRSRRNAVIFSPNRNRPPVASADSTNDTSNAARGSRNQTPSRLHPRARGAHARFCQATHKSCTESIHAARRAEPDPPAKSA